MNIKQFIEDSDRKLNDLWTDEWSKMSPPGQFIELKSFTSSKLRELIGEVRKEVERMRNQWKWVKESDGDYGEITECSICGEMKDSPESAHICEITNITLNSILQLLGEAGGK